MAEQRPRPQQQQQPGPISKPDGGPRSCLVVVVGFRMDLCRRAANRFAFAARLRSSSSASRSSSRRQSLSRRLSMGSTRASRCSSYSQPLFWPYQPRVLLAKKAGRPLEAPVQVRVGHDESLAGTSGIKFQCSLGVFGGRRHFRAASSPAEDLMTAKAGSDELGRFLFASVAFTTLAACDKLANLIVLLAWLDETALATSQLIHFSSRIQHCQLWRIPQECQCKQAHTLERVHMVNPMAGAVWQPKSCLLTGASFLVAFLQNSGQLLKADQLCEQPNLAGASLGECRRCRLATNRSLMSQASCGQNKLQPVSIQREMILNLTRLARCRVFARSASGRL